MRHKSFGRLIIHVALVEAIGGLALSALAAPTPPPTGGPKWVRVHLPPHRRPGEPARLECDYDLGNDTLYAVKWYKDDEEFYRFVAKEHPPATSYRVDGVHVALRQSDSRRVLLPAVDVRTGGLYRCEVSAEAPSFASKQSEARMDVIFAPTEDPTITGVALQYRIGDDVDLNCTSGKSFPATSLRWYINEKHVSGGDALIAYPARQHRDGLITTVLGLRFALQDRHFLAGSMRAKCVASVAEPRADLREALLLVRSGAAQLCASMVVIHTARIVHGLMLGVF